MTVVATPPRIATREQLRAQAELMLAAANAHGSPQHARVLFDGAPGGYGSDIDGLEGFARTFLLAGFLLKGSNGKHGQEAAEWYAQGIAAGVDPHSPERWTRLDEHPQAKVEAASIALILDMTRPWIWDKLSDVTRQQVVDYLSPAVGDQTYPRINWVWFRLVVQTFLKSVGGPHSLADMEADLATHDSFVRPGGWLADGPERSFDHYVGWALHLYPTLWARMEGAGALATARGTSDRDRLDRYLGDALALVGADGSPLIQGRSLTYRFAAAAPFWIGALAEVPSHRPGALRHAALSIVNHFVEHGAPDEKGVLNCGWHGAWPELAQSYSGPGSPYWASKGMFGLALPEDHPVWTDADVSLPVEQADVLIDVQAPGWIVSGTSDDGIVRVINHGTDHACEGDVAGDSPLYARLGYSTATAPPLDEASWLRPLDQSVCLVSSVSDSTHRSGMRVLDLRVDDDGATRVGVASSVSEVRWLEPGAEQERHGSGLRGRAIAAGTIAVVSLVRGPYELRLASVTELTQTGRDRASWLRISGWPVAGQGAIVVNDSGPRSTIAEVATDRLVSRVYASTSDATASVSDVRGASPLGPTTIVPWIRVPVEVGAWVTCMVELSGSVPWNSVTREPPQAASFDADIRGNEVTVTWPDGKRTVTLLTTTFPAPHVRGSGK